MARNDYKWDGDSRDERASVFANSGYSTTTGSEFHSSFTHERVQRKRRARPGGMLVSLLVAAGVSAALLYGLGSYLRG